MYVGMDVLVKIFKHYASIEMGIKHLQEIAKLFLCHIFVVVEVAFCCLLYNSIPNMPGYRRGYVLDALFLIKKLR